MKTWHANKTDSEAQRKWFLVDAANKSLGRISTEIARVLRGKHKATFSPHSDMGDFVVVVNANKVTMTGNKWDEKKFYRRSRFFGSLREILAKDMLIKEPTFLLRESVEGMLPKTKLGKHLATKLKVYAGPEHPHAAQKPEMLNIKIGKVERK